MTKDNLIAYEMEAPFLFLQTKLCCYTEREREPSDFWVGQSGSGTFDDFTFQDLQQNIFIDIFHLDEICIISKDILIKCM